MPCSSEHVKALFEAMCISREKPSPSLPTCSAYLISDIRGEVECIVYTAKTLKGSSSSVFTV